MVSGVLVPWPFWPVESAVAVAKAALEDGKSQHDLHRQPLKVYAKI